MMRSLYAGISGLRNHQTRMDVIGNNIANVNTVGFKGSRVNFQDMLSQTLQGASGATTERGGTNPVQIGLGMGVASIDTIFTDGSFQTTGKQSDLAISGQGFFILSDGLNQVYTRSGAFDFDTEGNFLVPGTGYKVMGYKADSTGTIGQTLESIQIPVGTSMEAKVSTGVTYTNNLMASATAIGSATDTVIDTTAALTAASNVTAALTAATTAAASAIIPANATLVLLAQAAETAATDSITAAQAAKDAADKVVAGTGTTAEAEAAAKLAATAAAAADKAAQAVLAAATTAGDAATIAAAQAVANVTDDAVTATATASATATAGNDRSSDALTSISVYDSQGNAYQLKGTFEKTGNNTWSFTPAATISDASGAVIANVTAAPIVIEFNSNGTFKQSSASASIKIDPTGIIPPSPYAGAGAFSVTPDFSTMTQYGGATTVAATAQNGYASGTLEKTNINGSGIIVGQFSNGQILNLAQVALANFNNPSGLGKAGESLYVKTTNSGEPQIGFAGTGGRGSFSAGSLEMSNVDLAQQFSDMIVTQRGFQANSKIITTTDTMLEELVNLKR